MFLSQLIVLFLITFHSVVAPYGYDDPQGTPVPSGYSQGSYQTTQTPVGSGMSTSPTSVAPSYSQPHHLQMQHQPSTPPPPPYSNGLQNGLVTGSPASYGPTSPGAVGGYSPYSPTPPQSPHTSGQTGFASQQAQFNQAQAPVLLNNYVPPPLPTDPRNADLSFIREE